MISNGVMLNAYPDSIGEKLSDTIAMLQRPEFKDVFSLFYVLPTFFNSDLDRGFSIIDYNLNEKLVSKKDLQALEALNIQLKFDIVLNHLSVASPQFKDLITHGEQSKFKDFFIDWNAFWEGHGSPREDGVICPNKTHLQKLFMRKPGLPVLKVPFPDGSERAYWNTFYQAIHFPVFRSKDLQDVDGLSLHQATIICKKINTALENEQSLTEIDFADSTPFKKEILQVVNSKRTFLGQMDVNAKSELVWAFYEETLEKLKGFGGSIVRLDAFAYLHKEIGESNFFNSPGTWNYLQRIKEIAVKNQLTLLPEIHAEYGLHLHDEVAKEGYAIYDFFLPGLTLHTIENKSNKALLKWAREIVDKKFKTVNMLGCHDGIPVIDLKGKQLDDHYSSGLLEDPEIEGIMETIIERGGRVKNLFGPTGEKISYYQVNATFFSALGEDENKLLLARAIQLFMPGTPQIWYLDLFAGKNDYAAADKAGSGGHKEINRSNLSLEDVAQGCTKDIILQQLQLLRLRNTSKAFSGEVSFNEKDSSTIDILWSYYNEKAHLVANLHTGSFRIQYTENGEHKSMSF